MRVIIAYYHDFFDKHAGGVLSYNKTLTKNASGDFQFVYWCREGTNKEESKDYPNVQVKYFCSNKRWKFIPEIIRMNYHIALNAKNILKDGDILFIQMPQLIFPWIFARRNIPLVVIMHGGSRRDDRLILSRSRVMFNTFCDWLSVKNADKIILVSKEAYHYYMEKYPSFKDKFIYIPTFADDKIIPTENKEEEVKILNLPSSKNICYVGRLDPPKKLDTLIDVFYHLQKRLPDYHLCIAGEGSLKNMMMERARKYGILEKINFLGVLDRRKVGLLFRASELNFLLTRFEGTSCALLESLACGTPSVVSDVADHKDIIQNGENGYVVNGETPQQIAVIAEELIKDYPRLHHLTAESGEKFLSSQVVPKVLDSLSETLEKYRREKRK